MNQKNWFINILPNLLVMIICLLTDIPADAGNLESVIERKGIFSSLQSDAQNWFQAVLSKDQKALISFALPEYRPSIDEKLKDENSTLVRVLFKGPESIHGKFTTIEQMRIALFKELDLERFGNGTWVCFYDKSRSVLQWRDSTNLPPNDTFCVFFFRADNRWYVSYDF